MNYWVKQGEARKEEITGYNTTGEVAIGGEADVKFHVRHNLTKTYSLGDLVIREGTE